MKQATILRNLSVALFAAATAFSAETQFSNPVLAGDYPDPSIIRVGDVYWATATSSEWAPLFPLLRSKDLTNWELVGNALQEVPEWAVANFWAPEIWQHKGRYYMYYVGRKRGGPLALAVATAEKPTGPWKDHGPLIAQEAGSIDAMPVADTDGTLYLIWKEDGNSRNKPTPLWIQKLSEDGTRLVGEMKEIMRNDADWERNLIEGPFIQRRGDYWYIFYSGNACCGRSCNYALGVARAKNLMGPWEKCPRNPLLAGTEEWKCPGHGSIVTDQNGRDWLLYHAYEAKTFVYTGRQGLLDEVTWGADGWPSINQGKGASTVSPAPLPPSTAAPGIDYTDSFGNETLSPHWQWPVSLRPKISTGGGKLRLQAAPAAKDPFISGVAALRTTSGDYHFTTTIDMAALKTGQSSGLSAFGDRENALGASVRDGTVVIWRRMRGKHVALSTNAIAGESPLHLRLNATDGHRFTFSTSSDKQNWKAAGGSVDVEGDYLPPWDRGIRVALVVGGENTEGVFGPVRLENSKKR